MSYTLFEYMYRDADNYKKYGSVWLINDGRLICEDQFSAFLEQGEFFIAEQVGLPALQFDQEKLEGLSAADHVWHSFVGFRSGLELPTGLSVFASLSSFLDRFENQAGRWNMECAKVYQHIF